MKGALPRWTCLMVALYLASGVLCGVAHAADAGLSPPGPAIFDSDPDHIWNRTYGCLFVRQGAGGTAYGADVPDPLLWSQTRFVMTGESHRRAIACLDEFIHGHAERAVQDPVKRAILQHDLWALFDWVATGSFDWGGRRDWPKQDKQELETRLAKVIRRLALTPEQIRALPDTFADAVAAQRFATQYDPVNPQRPFLPPDLFSAGGAWVCLSAYSEQPTAAVHFTGRSRFLVFLRLPGGREATLEYLGRLRDLHAQPLLPGPGGFPGMLNLGLPQFPVGTAVALVRQAILIDSGGKLARTALTEDVQLRVYHAITPGERFMNYINGPSSHDQDFFEFQMSRPDLFTQKSGGLLAVRPGETAYATFSTHGVDPFEDKRGDRPGVVLNRCRSCHSDSGIHSVQSRLQWMKPWQNAGGQVVEESRDAIMWETEATLEHKVQGPEFLLLRKLWPGARD
jgi:hypothetical protein